MNFKKTPIVTRAILDKITSGFKKRLVNNEYRQDYQKVKNHSLQSPSASDRQNNQRIISSAANSATTTSSKSLASVDAVTQKAHSLRENYALNPFYRRFVSPRKLIGKLIDRIKNKFYYETHHFVGAVIDKQEQFNKDTASTLSSISETLAQQQSQLASQQELLQKISSLEETTLALAAQLQHSQSQIEENDARVARILNSLLNYTSAIRRKVDTTKEELTAYQEQAQKTDDKLEFFSTAINSIGKTIDKLTTTFDNRINRLKYPHLQFNYVDFEQTFYGDHESLQKKHSQYLKYLEGTQNVIDVGCGSGAFLQLLKDQNISAIGIDTNPEVVKDAKKNGHKVLRQDALAYLKSQPDNGFGAITSFHMIEHLHPEDWLNFFQLCYQKLQPGGKLILETPNNNMLGIFNKGFYMDPTHVRPVHPQTAEFVLKDLGFQAVEIFTSSPLPDGDRLNEVSDPAMNKNIEKLNQTLFGHQDLSIIATK